MEDVFLTKFKGLFIQITFTEYVFNYFSVLEIEVSY